MRRNEKGGESIFLKLPRIYGLIVVAGLVLLPGAAAARTPAGGPALPRQLEKFDRNGDGELAGSEIPYKMRGDLLRRYDTNGDRALDGDELQAYAAQHRRQAQPMVPTGEPSDPVREVVDLAYASGPTSGDSFGMLDLYLPRNMADFPVLFWIHGGGLAGGDKSQIASVARRFVQHGYGVASVNYRLSPAVKFPTHIEDAAKAFRWVYDHIDEYGGAPDRLFVSGGSAGGHLAILLALDARYLESQELSIRDLRGTIPISALMDVSGVGPARLDAVWSREPETIREASPMTYVRPDAPPILMLYADGDTADRIEQNRAMFAALNEAGHPDVAIQELQDRTHTTVRPNLAREGDPGLLAMLEFMDRLGARRLGTGSEN